MNASRSEKTAIIYDVLWCDYIYPQDCLGIQNVSRQEPAACTAVNFLLHHRVLYEISTFGLQDSAEKVNQLLVFLMHFIIRFLLTEVSTLHFSN